MMSCLSSTLEVEPGQRLAGFEKWQDCWGRRGFVRVGQSDKKQRYAIKQSQRGCESSRAVPGFTCVFCGDTESTA